MNLNTDEKRMLLELISKEQIKMITSNHGRYKSSKYKTLERIKVKISEARG